MNSDQILVTGGSGLLGTELKNYLKKAQFPTSQEFNIVNGEWDGTFLYIDYLKKKGVEIKEIIHCAAFVSPPKVEEDPMRALSTNIVGTANMVALCYQYDMKLVYISTDYVFDGVVGSYREEDSVHPINKYAWSKLGGECATRLYDNSLIIRLSFGKNEFPYEKAFTDQWTSRISVSEAAKIIAKLATKHDDLKGVIHIGSDRKTVFDYATTLSPKKNIKPASIADMSVAMPKDTSLDCGKYKRLVGDL